MTLNFTAKQRELIVDQMIIAKLNALRDAEDRKHRGRESSAMYFTMLADDYDKIIRLVRDGTL